jgi:hypothetical protein
MPGSSTSTKTKDQLETELYVQVIKTVVVKHVNTTRQGMWEVCAAVQQAKRDGFREELIRTFFRKALVEVVPDTKSLEFKAYQAIINRGIRLGLAFEPEVLERKRKDKTYTEICAELAKIEEARNTSNGSRPIKKETAAADTNDLAEIMTETTSTPTPKAKPKINPPPKGWIAPEARSAPPSSKNADDWKEESLAIISDQFPRFLNMIEEARECDTLSEDKLFDLKEALQ